MFWSFWKGLAKGSCAVRKGRVHKRYTLSRHKVPAHPKNVLRHGPQPKAAGFVKESIMKTTKALDGLLLGRVICPGTFTTGVEEAPHRSMCMVKGPWKTGSKS
jgi:hypothetical protein